MGIRFNCTCGATYKIKDKYGGKLVRCKECNKITEAPTLGEQFAQQGAAVPKDKKLAAGAVPPPSFFDTAFIRPDELNATTEDTRPKMQTLESYDTHAEAPRTEVPIHKDGAPKKKRKSQKNKLAHPDTHKNDGEPETVAHEEEPDEVEDALSELASASQSKRRRKSRRSRRRTSAATPSRRRRETVAFEPDPEAAQDPLEAESEHEPDSEPQPEPQDTAPPVAEIEEMIAFASAKAHARRARRRAVVYVDPVKTPNKTAEAMKKGFKKFLVLAADHIKTFATATGRAAKHLFSGPDAGQINVIANIGPTRSAQAGLVVLILFVAVGMTGQWVHPESLGQLNTHLAGVSKWILPLLLALLPALMMLCFFGAAQLLGQKPEMEEMGAEEGVDAPPLPDATEVDAEASEAVNAAEDESTVSDNFESEQAQDIEEVGEADEADAVEAAEAEETSPEIQMPNLSWINFKASVFVTGVALLPLIVQSLVLIVLWQIGAPAEVALAVQLAVMSFLALLVYHALWGVLNLSQRWAFLATPAMLLLSYSLWIVLARAAAV